MGGKDTYIFKKEPALIPVKTNPIWTALRSCRAAFEYAPFPEIESHLGMRK